MSRRNNIFLGERPTTLFNRLAAKGIDALLVAAIYYLARTMWGPLGVLVSVLLCLLHDGFGEGQSIGKRVIGLRVIDEATGTPASFHASLNRNALLGVAVFFAAIPALWGLLVLVGIPAVAMEVYLLMSLPTGVRLGDVLGNTSVIESLDDSSLTLEQ